MWRPRVLPKTRLPGRGLYRLAVDERDRLGRESAVGGGCRQLEHADIPVDYR